ncbi:uncharacterized protein LOC124887892 [Capsicum annuum]|uniref:uncharacterized protein LOC124887892 n=1 Tax=Capsicum annuum TaxID=4072 RepID=UPI001FB076E8|nr:uncharacterized protein LOC124887892 [Capsicum annuum]
MKPLRSKPSDNIDKCYKLYGFPPGFKFTKPLGPRITVAHVKTAPPVEPTVSSTPITTSPLPGLTIDQHTQLLSLLQQTQISQPTPDAPLSSLMASAAFAGPFSKDASGSWDSIFHEHIFPFALSKSFPSPWSPFFYSFPFHDSYFYDLPSAGSHATTDPTFVSFTLSPSSSTFLDHSCMPISPSPIPTSVPSPASAPLPPLRHSIRPHSIPQYLKDYSHSSFLRNSIDQPFSSLSATSTEQNLSISLKLLSSQHGRTL